MLRFKLCKGYNQVEVEYDSVESFNPDQLYRIYDSLPEYSSNVCSNNNSTYVDQNSTSMQSYRQGNIGCMRQTNNASTYNSQPQNGFIPLTEAQRKNLKWMYHFSDEELNNMRKQDGVTLMRQWNADHNQD